MRSFSTSLISSDRLLADRFLKYWLSSTILEQYDKETLPPFNLERVQPEL
jgi:hypothetical protein